MPIGQIVHAVRVTVSRTVPVTDAKRPAAQLGHSFAPLPLYLPASQDVQVLSPVVAAAFPAAQSVQIEAPVAL